jgi:hypothetical protein
VRGWLAPHTLSSGHIHFRTFSRTISRRGVGTTQIFTCKESHIYQWPDANVRTADISSPNCWPPPHAPSYKKLMAAADVLHTSTLLACSSRFPYSLLTPGAAAELGVGKALAWSLAAARSLGIALAYLMQGDSSH